MEINEGKDVSDVIAAGKVQAECTKQLEGMLQDWIGKKVCIFINHVYQNLIHLSNYKVNGILSFIVFC